MPLTQVLLLNFPAWFLFLTISFISVVLCVSGILIMRRLVPHNKLKSHNDIAGPIFATLGVIYAVLLAFVVITVWQNFDELKSNVEKEANSMASLYRDSGSFEAQSRIQIRSLLGEYARMIINDEWKAIARGEPGRNSLTVMNKIWDFYNNYSPNTLTQQVFFEESVKKLNEMFELRRLRLMESRTGLQPILWFVLIAGAIVTIMFTIFFGSDNLWAKIIMSVLLALIISLILFTILQLDFPFSGSATISPGPFQEVIDHYKL